jgi:hypothetical protein
MIKAVVSDFSRTLLFPMDSAYEGSLNALYREHKSSPDFKFFDYFVWNRELKEFYEENFATRGIPVHIFTTENYQEDPEIQPYTQLMFASVLAVKDLDGSPKDNPVTYLKLAAKLEVQPEEILFVDDSDVNINAAKESGLQTIKYKNMTQVTTDFQTIAVKNDLKRD